MNKVVVTGGIGYIGSHTVVSLIEKGITVVIVDNMINSNINTLDGIESITGVRPEFHDIDMTDGTLLHRFFDLHKDADAVIHFAALKAVGDSSQQPILYYRNNLFALINLIEGMQKHEISNLVFSSSATVYGTPDFLPITEDHPTKRGMSPYGNSKKIGEEIIEDTVNSAENFKAISLRYFNPIGAHPSYKIGESPNGVPNNLMPYVTQTAAGVRKELSIFGDDYNTPDGTAIRDYIHIVDLAEAHVKTVERLLEDQQKSNFEIFNLGTGQGKSVLEVIESFERMSGQKLPQKITDRRDGDVEQMYSSTERASNDLGWNSKLGLDEMTSSAWEWEKKNRKI